MIEILAHTTHNELEFIDSIGSNSAEYTRFSRAELLRMYINSLIRRVKWIDKNPNKPINLDKKIILKYAKEALRKEEQK